MDCCKNLRRLFAGGDLVKDWPSAAEEPPARHRSLRTLELVNTAPHRMKEETGGQGILTADDVADILDRCPSLVRLGRLDTIMTPGGMDRVALEAAASGRGRVDWIGGVPDVNDVWLDRA